MDRLLYKDDYLRLSEFEPLSPDDMAGRERACWEYWFSIDPREQARMKKTVRDELLRLADSVDNWVPGTMLGITSERSIELRLVIYPDVVERSSRELTESEQEAAKRAAAAMAGILGDTA
jgi:hypothetical protein